MNTFLKFTGLLLVCGWLPCVTYVMAETDAGKATSDSATAKETASTQPAPTQPATTQPAPPTPTTPTPDKAASGETTAPPAGTIQLIPTRPGRDHYRVQADRNLFVRRSGSRQSASNASTPANPTTSSPASQWLLTGTITLGPQQVAFFENTRSGETLRLTIGQTMPAGKLLIVETDQVTMEIEGQPQKVALGERLLPGTAASGSGDPAPGVTDKPESEMSLLERLRARRQKELGR